ncbi:MAG: LysE family translocator [Candidatus Rokubacteria bacterium]|nr:LysE family translocator [Candidatus Rokubacteria bacterium]
MTLETWALFAITEAALCFTPGPAVLLVLSQGLTRGTGPSVYANLGILTGNAVYFALSATGLGAVLLASYELFSAIRWIGAAYLVWLGVTAFFGRSRVLTVDAAAPTSAARTFVNGVVLQVANPKALVFFVALLPPFIDPRGAVLPQVAILGVTSVIIEFVVLLAYGALAGRLTVVAARPRFHTLANRVAGTMLVAAGVSVALQRGLGGPVSWGPQVQGRSA